MKRDTGFIRSQYPVFQNPGTARWAMFENAGGSYVPRQVTGRLHDFFRYTKVQPYGLCASSIRAGEAMDAGYGATAGPLHAEIAALAGIEAYVEAVYSHHFTEDLDGFHARARKVFELFAENETAIIHCNTGEEGDRLVMGLGTLIARRSTKP
jgi:hypothetical protein